MRSTSWFGQGLAAVLLLAAGAILWRAGELEQRVAAAETDLVTLRYDSAAATAAEAPSRLAALLPGESRTVADAATLQSTAAYWEGDYNTVATNPQAKLLAANAAYRTARRQGGTWQAESAGSIRSSRATPRSCAKTPTTPKPRSITSTPSGCAR